MLKQRLALLITMAVFAAAPALMAASAIEPITSYQGFLADSDGAPLNGTFDMTFRIFDGSGAMVWEESHAAVQVSDGLFNVVLGATDPIPPDAFVGDTDTGEYALRFLQIQIGEDPPLSPTTRLLTAPYSVATHRVAGDFFSMPGAIQLFPPDPIVPPDPIRPEFGASVGDFFTQLEMVPPPDADHPPSDDELPAIQLFSDNLSHAIRLNWQQPPPDDEYPEMEMRVDQNAATFGMSPPPDDGIPPPDDDMPTIELYTDDMIHAMRLNWQIPPPDDQLPEMEMKVDQTATVLGMVPPPDDIHPPPDDILPAIQLFSDNLSHAIRLNWQQPPPDDQYPEMEMRVDQNAATFGMHPPPDDEIPPPDDNLPAIQLYSDNLTHVLRLNWQQPPPDDGMPELEMSVRENSTTFRMGIDPNPFNPAFEMNANLNSTTFRMGIDPVPFNPSVEFQAMDNMTDFSMFDPSAGSDDKTVSKMSSMTGGQFGWNLFHPNAGEPRPIMEMNTGPGGEISWLMFNPQPEPPGEPLIKMITYGDPTGADIQLFDPPPGTSIYPNVDIFTEDGRGGIILREAANAFTQLQTPRGVSYVDGASGATVGAINPEGNSFLSGNLGLGTSDVTNILTIVRGSSTDPIADAWTTYSSRKWKKNIKTIDNAIDKVRRLRGVTFDWKSDGRHDIGLIAEEVGEVIPEVVAYEQNGVDAKSVDYSRLVAVLIEGMKQQQQKIDELERRVKENDDIRARLSDLESALSMMQVKMRKEKGKSLFKQISN